MGSRGGGDKACAGAWRKGENENEKRETEGYMKHVKKQPGDRYDELKD